MQRPMADLKVRATCMRIAGLKVRATCVLLMVLLPLPARAWGFDAHKTIAEHFIALLPADLKPLFVERKAYIIERSVDPDLWRTVGWEAEPPNHFLDLDFYGRYPFVELPHEYDRAVQKFGAQVVAEQGTVPWRAQEFFGNLEREFRSLTRGSGNTYALDNIVLFAAILAHYVSDGHVPLHAVVNYDGQKTNQLGLHSRWEAELFERNRARIKIAPAAPTAIADPREFMFQTLLVSNQLAEGVLQSDAKAARGRAFYDEAYFDVLATEQLSVLERRLNDSVTAVAGMVIGAWEQAGRPQVPRERPARAPRPIRPPGRER
jgi:hypothetical protein